MSNWTAPTILAELCAPERQVEILATFWKKAPAPTRTAALQLLARAMRFREVTLRKAPPPKKAAWALKRLRDPSLEQVFREALLAWHMEHARPLMSACLDSWGVPHEDGVVEAEEYELPDSAGMAERLDGLRADWPDEDLALYFAAAGLVMGEERPEWRDGLWPMVDTLRGDSATEG